MDEWETVSFELHDCVTKEKYEPDTYGKEFSSKMT